MISTLVSHDREFLFKPRGFETIQEHDEEIIRRWNETVTDEDTVYILGDLMLNDNIHGIECLKQLKGHKYFIRGNHDTAPRIELYSQAGIVYMGEAASIRYGKYHIYMSHYPTLTANLDETHFSQHLLNFYGHTHQKSNFYNDIPFLFHVGLDSHDCYPVAIDTAIAEMRAKYKECGDML